MGEAGESEGGAGARRHRGEHAPWQRSNPAGKFEWQSEVQPGGKVRVAVAHETPAGFAFNNICMTSSDSEWMLAAAEWIGRLPNEFFAFTPAG